VGGSRVYLPVAVALRAFLTVLAAWAFVAGGLAARYSRPDTRKKSCPVYSGRAGWWHGEHHSRTGP
jgi:hypothetical protein